MFEDYNGATYKLLVIKKLEYTIKEIYRYIKWIYKDNIVQDGNQKYIFLI